MRLNSASLRTVGVNCKMSKIFRIVYNFFAILIVLFFLFTAVVAVSGTKVYAVATGSMEPTIPDGSVVFVRPRAAYEVGDVITAFLEGQQTYTHRIVKIDGERIYTKGDANGDVDPTPTKLSRIVGKVVFHLPLLGLLSLKLSVPVLIIAFAAILVVLILIRFIVAQKQKRRGDHADEKNQ